MSVRGEYSDVDILGSGTFLNMLVLERKRSERSERRFVLMLLKPDNFHPRGDSKRMLIPIFSALYNATRESDIKGWYDQGSTGVIFTEIDDTPGKSVIENAVQKGEASTLRRYRQPVRRFKPVLLYLSRRRQQAGSTSNFRQAALYPDGYRTQRQAPWLGLERMMDLAGSLFGLILCAPLLFTIAF